MFKKGFSTILIVVIVLVVIAGGTLAWQYWPEPVEQDQQETEQVEQPIDNEQPETNGSNQSAISILLEELKQATQLNF